MMFAKLINKENSNANYNVEKELTDSYTAVVIRKGKIKTPVTIKCYMGRSASASTVYCNIWAGNNEFTVSGTGQAGGYGYHKTSSAVGQAIGSAGFKLFGPVYSGDNSKSRKPARIDGVGSEAIRKAMVAICRCLGYSGQVRVI